MGDTKHVHHGIWIEVCGEKSGIYSVNVQDFSNHLTCALDFGRTYGCKQQKTAETGGSENALYYKDAGCSVEPR